MKRYFALFCCIFLMAAFVITAHAVEDESDFNDSSQDDLQAEAIPDTDMSMDITIDDSVSGSRVISELIQQLGNSNKDELVSDDYRLVGVELRSLNPIQPSGGNSLKDSLLSFVGDYDAVVVEYQYQSQTGNYQYLREIQPDYVWMCSVALLIVFIFCLFRLGGAILCKR